jgi:hypothetical protein
MMVVFQQRGERADRGLVAGDDRDGAGQAGGLQMLAQRIMRDFAADQRVAHFPRAVADAVRGGDRVLGLDETQLELTGSLTDAVPEAFVDRVHFRHNAKIALAVAFGSDHADRRMMDQIGIGAERVRQADGLGRAARMAVDKDGF